MVFGTFEVMPHHVESTYLNRTWYPQCPTLTPLYWVVTRHYQGVRATIFTLLSLNQWPQLTRSRHRVGGPAAGGSRLATTFARGVLRASALARRVAAAYGDANLLPKKGKMHDCQPFLTCTKKTPGTKRMRI